MPPRRQKDHIAGGEFAAGEVLSIFGIEVYLNPTAFYEQRLLGIPDLPVVEDVDMLLDGIALVVLHVPQLLGEVAGCEEGDAIFRIVVIDNDGKALAITLYFFYGIHLCSSLRNSILMLFLERFFPAIIFVVCPLINR